MQRIILASSSPRRKELLKNLGLPFEILVPDVDENLDKSLPCDLYVRELALLKGSAALKKCLLQEKDCLVISADTIVSRQGEILEKPKSMDDARCMLTALSGAVHEVYSGVCVLNEHQAVCRAAKTQVEFRPLSKEQIENYIHTGEPYDKAGAYALQGEASGFVKNVIGDYYNVVGLPMELLCQILREDFSFDAVKVYLGNH